VKACFWKATIETEPHWFGNWNFEKFLKAPKLYFWINKTRNPAWKKPTDFEVNRKKPQNIKKKPFTTAVSAWSHEGVLSRWNVIGREQKNWDFLLQVKLLVFAKGNCGHFTEMPPHQMPLSSDWQLGDIFTYSVPLCVLPQCYQFWW